MENEDYVKTNREKRLSPKSDGKYWCEKCDCDLVGNWEKCPTCGYQNGTRTLKKDI